MKYTDKGFIIHWIDKTKSYIVGKDIHEALTNFGYPDSSAFIDWYDEPKEFPKDKKIIVEYDSILYRMAEDTIFVSEIRKNINEGKREFSIRIAHNVYEIIIKELPFMYQVIDVSIPYNYGFIHTHRSLSGASIRKFIIKEMEYDKELMECFKRYFANNCKYPAKDTVYYYLNNRNGKYILIRDLKKSPRNINKRVD